MNSGFCKCDPCYAGKGCNSLCMGRGTCGADGKCVCDPLGGWRGDLCEMPGCPGIGQDCTGHGDCNAATRECTCNEGWTGVGCEVPDCPGAPDCFGRGICNATLDPPMCQNCISGWMGAACNNPCTHGLQVPMNSGNCVCDKGWVGVGCDSECSGHGSIIGGVCQCHVGWRGHACENPGCPGDGTDCTGHGECNGATHVCTCHAGWMALGCNIPDCPGDPNCFNRGFCNGTTNPPLCQNCNKGWMGPACNDPCTHGAQTPMNSGNCSCEPGWVGVGCDSECSEHGKIINGTCQCIEGWRGTACERPGCPGVGIDCTNHGQCNAATHVCQCYDGWTGKGCDLPDCPGKPNCNARGQLFGRVGNDPMASPVGGQITPNISHFFVKAFKTPKNLKTFHRILEIPKEILSIFKILNKSNNIFPNK